jgi:uncharacterized protein (DUF1697 family)
LFISLLRGINVAAQKKILMADLKKLYEKAGLTDVQNYVQSGNIIFSSKEKNISKLTSRIEEAIEKEYKFHVPVIVMDNSNIKKVISSNPYKEKEENLYVTFLYELPSKEAVQNIKPPEGIKDEFSIKGNIVYVYCPGGYGRTKISNTYFEKKLKVPATTRNWNTVNTLYEMSK